LQKFEREMKSSTSSNHANDVIKPSRSSTSSSRTQDSSLSLQSIEKSQHQFQTKYCKEIEHGQPMEYSSLVATAKNNHDKQFTSFKHNIYQDKNTEAKTKLETQNNITKHKQNDKELYSKVATNINLGAVTLLLSRAKTESVLENYKPAQQASGKPQRAKSCFAGRSKTHELRTNTTYVSKFYVRLRANLS